MALALEPAHQPDRNRTGIDFPLTGKPVDGIPSYSVEPFGGLGELTGEHIAPHFAIGDDVYPGPLLDCHALIHRTILDEFEVGIGYLAGPMLLASLKQVVGA